MNWEICVNILGVLSDLFIHLPVWEEISVIAHYLLFPNRSTTMEWSPSAFRWVNSLQRLSPSVTVVPSLPLYGLTCIMVSVEMCTTVRAQTQRSWRGLIRMSESISRIWYRSLPPGSLLLPGIRSPSTEAARQHRWGKKRYIQFVTVLFAWPIKKKKKLSYWAACTVWSPHEQQKRVIIIFFFSGKYISGSFNLRWPSLFCYV